jgi:hypothetical protein
VQDGKSIAYAAKKHRLRYEVARKMILDHL